MQTAHCKIINIIDEAKGVKSYILEKPKDFSFVAGQFAMLSFPDRRVKGRRSYSFCNSPLDSSLKFTVKVHGPFSSALFETPIGDTLEVRGPLGNTFNFDSSYSSPLVLIAGGVGITPFMSIMEYAIGKNMSNEILLFYSCKIKDQILFSEQLDVFSTKVKIIKTLTQDDGSEWGGEIGRIDEVMIKKYIIKIGSYNYMICGSDEMNHSLRKVLLEMGVSKENIKIEDWGL